MHPLNSNAEIAQLVEHNLAKVRVASSSLVFRSLLRMLEWWNGRHEGLKILWPVMAVRVQVPLRVQKETSLNGLSLFFMVKSVSKLLTGLFKMMKKFLKNVLIF